MPIFTKGNPPKIPVATQLLAEQANNGIKKIEGRKGGKKRFLTVLNGLCLL